MRVGIQGGHEVTEDSRDPFTCNRLEDNELPVVTASALSAIESGVQPHFTFVSVEELVLLVQ